ncbi:MAG TPA: hypothetical protein VFQ85_19260 [Mycobacteriales bacterium]|nr:hypothetical protein [Mycobacteriales bacterium]
MPVVVTAAETPLGRVVVERLRREGAEVRAVVGKPVTDLGVPTSLADWGDAERLGAVLEGAHTVIHLAGRRRVPDLLAAAEGSGVVRIITTAPHAALADAPYEVFVTVVRRWRPDLAEVAEILVAADRRV